jgi:hypothetical protein
MQIGYQGYWLVRTRGIAHNASVLLIRLLVSVFLEITARLRCAPGSKS